MTIKILLAEFESPGSRTPVKRNNLHLLFGGSSILTH
jgi:hypothetical protein